MVSRKVPSKSVIFVSEGTLQTNWRIIKLERHAINRDENHNKIILQILVITYTSNITGETG